MIKNPFSKNTSVKLQQNNIVPDKKLLGDKSDEDLIKETGKGSLAAFEILVKRYQSMILRYCTRVLKNQDEAEDATQDTFLKIFTNLKKFDNTRLFKPWAFRIAHNTCYDILREKSKITYLSWDIEYEAESTLAKMITSEEKHHLINALRKLPSKYKLPLVEFYFAKLDYKTIAEKSDLPLNTIRTRIRRGKLLLAEAVE